MTANSDELRDELLRLRERMHTAESAIVGLDLRTDFLVDWQRRVEPIIEDLREADRIAEAVAEKMNDRQTVSLTKVQKWTAVLGVVTAFAALLLDLSLRLYTIS